MPERALQQNAHPGHAETLKNRTQCNGNDAPGNRCQRTATRKGLCDTHCARRARTLPCRNSGCESGESRAPGKRGLCQPCLDAFNRTVEEQAAKYPPVGPLGKRRRL